MQKWQNKTPTYGCLLYFALTSLAIIFIVGIGALSIMAAGNVIPSSWYNTFTIIFVMLGVLLSFFQWVFPKRQNPPALSVPHSSSPPFVILTHKADSTNSTKNYTTIDSSHTNNKPHAHLFVTPTWDVDKIYNNHPIGIGYRKDIEKWSIFNQDQKDIPLGIAFHVLVIEEDWM